MRQLKLWLALITGLTTGLQMKAQTQVICKGATKTYKVDWQLPDPPTGTPGSTYAWTVNPSAQFAGSATGQGTNTYVINWGNTPAGDYTVEVIETNDGCSGDPVILNVTIKDLPTATVFGGGPVCASSPLPDVSFNLTGEAPWTLTYAINGTPQPPVTGITTSPYVISGAGAGSYTITAISDKNCTGTFTGSATVSIIPGPNATVSGGGTVCAGATLPNVSIALTGSQPWSVTYAINGIPQPTVTGIAASPFVINNAAVGNYTVLAVSDATCSGTFSGTATVTVTQLPTITLIGEPICNGVLNYTVNFSVSSGTPTSSVGTPTNTGGNNWTLAGIPAGTPVTISLSVSGCTATLDVLKNCACPTVALPNPVQGSSYCAGESVTSVSATVPAGFTVDWYDAATGGTRLQEGTTSGVNTYTPSGPGTFYAVARDLSSGCLSSTRTPATVTQNALPVVSASDASICPGESTQLSASGASTYTWSPTTGLSQTNGTPVTANPTENQTYTVTGTDSNGCKNTDTVTVTVKPKPNTSPIFHD